MAMERHHMAVTGAEELLLEILGLEFLSYVLNLDREGIAARLRDDGSLPEPQESILTELVSFLGSLPRSPDDFSLLGALSALAAFNPAGGMGWATAARVTAGGDVTLPLFDDDLRTSLVQLCRDVYPLFLLPPPPTARLHGLMMTAPSTAATVLQHPVLKTFNEAVMADATLRKLFPDNTEHGGQLGMVYRSTGSGSGFQLEMFAESTLQCAWDYALLGSSKPTLSDFGTCAARLPDLVRDAVEHRPLKIPALVGVAGVTVPEGTVVDLPWGRLREVSEGDRRIIPPSLSGQLNHTAADGSHITINYAGDLTMESAVDYRIDIGEVDSDVWRTRLISHQEMRQQLETLRLALLLSTKRDPAPIVVGTWQFFVEPLGQGRSMGWNDPRRAPGLMPASLASHEVDDWARWASLIHKRRRPNIDVAIRRTLAAAAERGDPTDALVDAVIAWENLVGSRQGEPTLRVSAALAWLLGSDADERSLLKKQIGDVYNARSDIVHGNRNLDPEEAGRFRQEALDIAVRALRGLFRDRAELLKDCRDSTERSNRLILGL